jgi:rhodanese-related sulfurtransferase
MPVPPPADLLTPACAAELLAHAEGARLVDVRTPGEYAAVHIAGGCNIPLDGLGEHLEGLRQSSGPVLLVCQSGARARRAEEQLRRAGVRGLRLLDGGIAAWIAAGQPVIRGTRRLSLERQVRIASGALAALGGALALTVSPWFALVPTFVGGGLVFAGLTDTCGMALLLARLPYNRAACRDVPAAGCCTG